MLKVNLPSLQHNFSSFRIVSPILVSSRITWVCIVPATWLCYTFYGERGLFGVLSFTEVLEFSFLGKVLWFLISLLPHYLICCSKNVVEFDLSHTVYSNSNSVGVAYDSIGISSLWKKLFLVVKIYNSVLWMISSKPQPNLSRSFPYLVGTFLSLSVIQVTVVPSWFWESKGPVPCIVIPLRGFGYQLSCWFPQLGNLGCIV